MILYKPSNQGINGALQSIPSLLVALVVGPMSDAYSRKPLILFSIGGYLLLNLIYLINSYWFYQLKVFLPAHCHSLPISPVRVPTVRVPARPHRGRACLPARRHLPHRGHHGPRGPHPQARRPRCLLLRGPRDRCQARGLANGDLGLDAALLFQPLPGPPQHGLHLLLRHRTEVCTDTEGRKRYAMELNSNNRHSQMKPRISSKYPSRNLGHFSGRGETGAAHLSRPYV